MKRKRGRPPGGITKRPDGGRTKEYRAWIGMIQRCHNPNDSRWKYYGGRGISVCRRWRDSFADFLGDMGVAPEGYWLDRINNDLGYQPDNCRWITPRESANNRRQRKPDPNSLPSRSKRAGLPFSLVYQRLQRGWPEHLALSTPAFRRGRPKGFTPDMTIEGFLLKK